MIKLITEHAAQSFRRRDVSALLFNGGVYRDPAAYRSTALLYSQGAPFAVARWYPPQGRDISAESEVLLEAEKAGLAAPRVLGRSRILESEIVFESYVEGQNLLALFERKLVSKDDALKLALQCFQELQQTKAQSTRAALAQELDEILSPFRAEEIFGAETGGVLDGVADTVLRFFGEQDYTTSLVHFDFSIRNIIVSDETPIICDFEFARRSHFGFYDWFSLWRDPLFIPGSFPILEQLGSDGHPDLVDRIQSDEQTVKAFSLLAALIENRIRRTVHPSYGVARLDERVRAEFRGSQVLSVVNGSGEISQPEDLLGEVNDLKAQLLQAESILTDHLSRTHQIVLEESDQIEKRWRHEVAHQIEMGDRKQETIDAQQRLIMERDAMIQKILRSYPYRMGRFLTAPIRFVRSLITPRAKRG